MLFTVISLVLGLVSSPCSFRLSNHKTYDLSSLNGTNLVVQDKKVSIDYTYEIAVCAQNKNLCNDIMTGKKLPGNVFQYGGEPGGKAVCWDVLAVWEDNVPASVLPSSYGNVDGLSLQFENGDICRGSPRKTQINLICGKDDKKSNGYEDPNSNCDFIMEWYTPAVCQPTHGWGINGTLSGIVSCASDDCEINNYSAHASGSCDGMSMTILGKQFVTIPLNFDYCAEYRATGELEKMDKPTNFEIFYDASKKSWKFLAFAKDEPFELMFSTDLADHTSLSNKRPVKN